MHGIMVSTKVVTFLIEENYYEIMLIVVFMDNIPNIILYILM